MLTLPNDSEGNSFSEDSVFNLVHAQRVELGLFGIDLIGKSQRDFGGEFL